MKADEPRKKGLKMAGVPRIPVLGKLKCGKEERRLEERYTKTVHD